MHLGTSTMNAPGNGPDIVVTNHGTLINVELTKSTMSSSDREFLAIKDHLELAKKNHPGMKCFVWYSSPETHYRTINAIRDHNIQHADDPDLKMLPICFSSLELVIDKFVAAPPELFPPKELLAIMEQYRLFVDDSRVLEILRDKLFSDDAGLSQRVELEEQERHQQTVDELIRDLRGLEDDLREERGVTHLPAIRDVIYLVFIKLYEEKREFEGKENRFKPETFDKYLRATGEETSGRGVHRLLDSIKKDSDLKTARVFTDTDHLSERIDDSFVVEFFIRRFEKYHFYTTRVDGIGAAYEVLGMRTGKDVKAGQFFTPENVVKFMVRMADLDVDDTVLDPACGTARFLIYSMRDMQAKALSRRNAKEKQLGIAKNQLFGADYDADVAKLAKMNMYINGDGKSNIFDRDGLLLYDPKDDRAPWNMDGRVDVILSNPPLGDLSFLRSEYDYDFKFRRMEVIPKRNLTQEKLDKQGERLKTLQGERAESNGKRLGVDRQSAKIDACRVEVVRLRALLADPTAIEWEPAGKTTKGGALFLGAAAHYLKPVRNAEEPIEWRGGKLLVILDEGILNTDEYRHIRQFLFRRFYIKAIVSLSRDTFVPVSKTGTKTSILYAIRKADPDAVQTEPVFFAHADKVGVDTRKHVCENHLFDGGRDVLTQFARFRKSVLASYVANRFDPSRFRTQGFDAGEIA